MPCSFRALQPAQLRQAILGVLTQHSPPAEVLAHMPAWCQDRVAAKNSHSQSFSQSPPAESSVGRTGSPQNGGRSSGVKETRTRSLSMGRVFSVSENGVNGMQRSPENVRRRHTMPEAEGRSCNGAETDQSRSATSLSLREDGPAMQNPVSHTCLSSAFLLVPLGCFCSDCCDTPVVYAPFSPSFSSLVDHSCMLV